MSVTNEEKTALKAACLQAATTLIAARDSPKGAVDVDQCVKLAELAARRAWEVIVRICDNSRASRPDSAKSPNS
jgi:hypothetical protein